MHTFTPPHTHIYMYCFVKPNIFFIYLTLLNLKSLYGSIFMLERKEKCIYLTNRG